MLFRSLHGHYLEMLLFIYEVVMDAQVDYCSLFGFGDVKEKDVATTMERKLRPMPMDVS